ncbi:MAG TPA: DUF2807 domain-containing protein [Sphingomicrobium sp.]|nr:DUF2807 domain-containing protein [Sphingomicrobium sp.]
MRTIFLAAAIFAIAAPAQAATRNFGITGFDKIRVDGPYRVTLTTGVPPFARASGSASALDGLTIEVRDDTLIVHSNLDSWGGYPGKDVGPVEVSLGTHELSAAWLNGSGSLSINHVQGLKFGLSVQGSGSADIAQAAVDQFDVSILGTASARLAGQAGKITAVVRGISTLDASGLSIKDATLGAEGAATIAADISGSVKVDASGPATVRLTGGPACTLQVSGSATVTGCR